MNSEDTGWKGENTGGNADVSGFGPEKKKPKKEVVKPEKLNKSKYGAFK